MTSLSTLTSHKRAEHEYASIARQTHTASFVGRGRLIAVLSRNAVGEESRGRGRQHQTHRSTLQVAPHRTTRLPGQQRKGNVLFNDALNTLQVAPHRTTRLPGQQRKGNVLVNDALNTLQVAPHRTTRLPGQQRKGNVLVNDARSTFYLRLYGVSHMVNDHSDSEIGNPLQPHGPLFPISSKGSFICTIPQT